MNGVDLTTAERILLLELASMSTDESDPGENWRLHRDPTVPTLYEIVKVELDALCEDDLDDLRQAAILAETGYRAKLADVYEAAVTLARLDTAHPPMVPGEVAHDDECNCSATSSALMTLEHAVASARTWELVAGALADRTLPGREVEL